MITIFQVKKEEYVNKTFRLNKALVEELALCAAANKISMNLLVAQCCRYALDSMKEEDEEQ